MPSGKFIALPVQCDGTKRFMAARLASASRWLVKISSTQLQPIPALGALNGARRLAFGSLT